MITYDFNKLSKDIERTIEEQKGEYEKAFRNFKNKIIDLLCDILRQHGFRYNPNNIEIVADYLLNSTKEYSKYNTIMNEIVDNISKAKYNENPVGFTEYNINEQKQMMKRIPLYDSYGELRNYLQKSIMVNDCVRDEINYEFKRRFDALCDNIGSVNSSLISSVERILQSNITNISNEQNMSSKINQISAITAFSDVKPIDSYRQEQSTQNINNNSNIPFNGFGINDAKEKCIEVFKKVSNGQITPEQAINFINNELSLLKPEDSKKILINLEWEIPANNPKLQQYLKDKEEELKSLLEETKKNELPSNVLI